MCLCSAWGFEPVVLELLGTSTRTDKHKHFMGQGQVPPRGGTQTTPCTAGSKTSPWPDSDAQEGALRVQAQLGVCDPRPVPRAQRPLRADSPQGQLSQGPGPGISHQPPTRGTGFPEKVATPGHCRSTGVRTPCRRRKQETAPRRPGLLDRPPRAKLGQRGQNGCDNMGSEPKE